MKRIALLLLTMIALAATPVRAEVEISFDFFHESLSPYGEWCEVDGYGSVWHPGGVDAEWAPYTDGYWTYTDAGWTWVSYEDFGGITYHYGRWVMLDGPGWCWVPDYEWGPAWVSWRKNDEYVGWAPLPPEARWERETGFSTWVDVNYDIGPGNFRFCSWRNFGAPVIRPVCEPRGRNVFFISNTVNITNISYRNDYDCVFNGGFDYDYVAPRVHHQVPALKLVRNRTTNIFVNGNKGNVFINSPRGNALVVAAPAVAKTNYNVLTKQLPTQRKFGKQHINRGWTGLEQKVDRDSLLVKMHEETKGKTRQNSPAREPNTGALAVLPKKADFDAKRPVLAVPSRDQDGAKTADSKTRGPEDRGVNKPEEPRKGGNPVASKERPEVAAPALQIPSAPSRENGQPGEIVSRTKERKKGDEATPAIVEEPKNRPMQKEREDAVKQQADAQTKDSQKEQRKADQLAKERQKAAEMEAARNAQAQQEATERAMNAERKAGDARRKQEQSAESDAKARKQNADLDAARKAQTKSDEAARQRAAEQNADANRERAMDAQRKAEQNASRAKAADAQRKQAEDADRHRNKDAERQRAAEQARANDIANQRRQAAESANRQRSADMQRQQAQAAQQQAEARARAQSEARAQAMQKAQRSIVQPPSLNRPPAPSQPKSKEDERGKDKDRNKRK